MPTGNISGKNLEKAITSDDVLGKEVIDAEGASIGIVEKILINPDTLEFMGIGVDKGFLKQGLVIGWEYIDRVTSFAVFLRIRVAFQVKGMQVFDKHGANIGRVKDIELYQQKNQIVSIRVSVLSRAFKDKIIAILSDKIASIGHAVILAISKDELLGILKKENREKS